MSKIKKNPVKRVLSMLLAVALLLTVINIDPTPLTVVAASSGSIIDVKDSTTASGDGWTYADGVFTVTGDVTIGSSAGVSTPVTNRIVVPSGADVEIVLGASLGGVNIQSSDCAFEIQTGAKVNLKLHHFNTLVSDGWGHAGLEVASGAELTISDLTSGGGTLTATGGTGGPGIGGGAVAGCGKITIDSGYIVAKSGGSFITTGAGIGSAASGSVGEITINGGIVKATGKSTGAGIGGAVGAGCGKITINGGDITATSVYAAGIGGGMNGIGGEITINGGIVNAKGGKDAGGDGVANDIGSGNNGAVGTTQITGGSVFAANGLIDGFTTPLYPVKVTVTNDGTKADGATVTSGSYIAKTGGNLTDSFASTLDSGVAWLWLPAGEKLVVADDGDSKAGVVNQTVEEAVNNTVSIALAPYTYILEWEGSPDTFAPLEYGYSTGSSVTYTIKNNGNKLITGLNATIATGSDNFEVVPGYDTTLAVGAVTSITVRSMTDKKVAGSPYTGTLSIAWTNGTAPITQSLSQVVNKAAPTALTPPAASAITYGAELSTSNLTGGSAGGTWEWVNETTIPPVSNNGYQVTFTPTDIDNYDWSRVTETTYTIDITVNKANPSNTAPTGLTATYGDALESVTLPTGWEWETAGTTPVGNAGNQTHKAKYTPVDTENYNTLSGIDVTISVSKANPSSTTPTGLTATYGDTLESVTLPTGWEWEAAGTTPVGNAGNQTHKAKFTPDDTDNYNTVTGVDVTISVSKANSSVPTGLTATYGDTLESVTLPTGWEWETAGTTPVGNAGNQTHKAKYTPVDTENYNTLSGIDVTITVNKKAITVTADNKEKIFGTADPALTYKVSGLVGSDKLTGSLKYAGSAVGKYDIIQNASFSNPNYTITFVKGTMTIKAATINSPNADKSAKTYTGSVKVKLTCSTPGAKIHYTTNGSAPTTKSPYVTNGGTVTVSKTTTLRFMAAATNHNNSSVVSVRYTIKTSKPDKTSLPSNKKVKKGTKIELKAPKGTTLYYTTNGKTPTANKKSKSIKAGKSAKITITRKTTVKVIAVKTGCKASAVVKRTYTLKK